MYQFEFSSTLEALFWLVVIFTGIYYVFKNIFKIWRNNKDIVFNIDEDIDWFESDYLKIFNWKYYIRKSVLCLFQNKYNSLYKMLKEVDSIPSKFKQKVKIFIYKYESLDKSRNHHNQNYVDNLKTLVWPELTKIFDKPFDDNQLDAIFHDEDHNLVIAWAWTGKTHTLLWKSVFLTKFMNISENKILVISFTNKTVDEVKERMQKYWIKNIKVKTFHSLWNEIIKTDEGKKQILDSENFEKEKKINEVFKVLLVENNDFKQMIVDYFLYYLKPYKTFQDFDNIRDYYKYMRETSPFTIDKIKVKSYQEAEIANFLTLNGIKYEYEAKYKFDIPNIIYKPDFYLPDYDIYIEHFAINKDYSSPFWKQYVDWIAWKRDIHKSNNTRLIETFSFEFEHWKIPDSFKIKLISFGIDLSPIATSDDKIIKKLKDWKELLLLSQLISTFLWLFKSNQEDYLILYQKQKDARNKKFLNIFKAVYDKYEDNLNAENKIDFDDMINKATKDYANRKDNLNEYEYILIDEFQDISVWRKNLIKTILRKNQWCGLFCVWDDWQSIYRFSGSDLSLFTNFSNYFGYTKQIILNKCFRFWKHISNITWKFIMKNPLQIKKTLVWRNDLERPITIVYYNDEQDKEKKLRKVLNNIQIFDNSKEKTLYFLSRYNDAFFPVSDNIKSKIHRFYKPDWVKYKLTCHKAKWLESDFVILNGLEDDFKWFPCKILDDPVLKMVLNIQEEITYAEERRLFYVALTRSKSKTYLFVNYKCPSIFVNELIEDNQTDLDYIWEFDFKNIFAKKCKYCWWRMHSKINKEWEEFDSCINRPYCNKKNYPAKRKLNYYNKK